MRFWKQFGNNATIKPMRTLDRKPGKFGQMKNDPLMTEAKFNELKKKLEGLKKSRPQAAAEVARLAELGDFSENVEYQLAKGRLRSINNRILTLETQLNQAEIIEKPRTSDIVGIGSTVVIERGEKEKTYQILGSSETDPTKGIISHTSPIGAALVGKKIGDKVKILLANGKEIEYKIIEIY